MVRKKWVDLPKPVDPIEKKSSPWSKNSFVLGILEAPPTFKCISNAKKKQQKKHIRLTREPPGVEHRMFQWQLFGLLVLGLEWLLVTSNPAKNFFELLKIDF